MTLEEFLYQLNEFARKNPAALKLPVYAATDDEGNGFNPIYYSPSVIKKKELYDSYGDIADIADEKFVCVN